MDFADLPLSAKSAYRSACQRARRNGLALLSENEFVILWQASNGKCALSGIAFSDDLETGNEDAGYVRANSYPWQPSLDQILPNRGYSNANVQLVCKCVNIGKSGYAAQTFARWVVQVAKQMGS
ncbi:hypothetical protein L0664_07390 [Octadecabacter sp. G9-8]|uniref:DUF2591 domain-containing protein n=1 Tax=Octadecabacter dasysiphoniae TaxID=2909341 RepID=A0ABS9CXJ4_9RHOB|nr:hypothetical protein [Octadecabacter dasysiphoniae]MCF2870886.1 hypothetical protein [Octadecabacter dasysiphoniae]